MSQLSNEYMKYTIQQMVVDSLEEDGAICNSSTKEYDKLRTLEGGIGMRLSFTKINDKINMYHDILACLSGEVRPNIYESIPVIDFVHPENTGFLSHYKEDSNGSIYQGVIEDTPIYTNDNISDLELLENKDPYTINRALMGLTMSEHFYNTSGSEMSDYCLQASVPDMDNKGFIYKGIPTVSTDDLDDQSIRTDTINIFSIEVPDVESMPTYIYFKANDLSLYESYIERLKRGNYSELRFENRDSFPTVGEPCTIYIYTENDIEKKFEYKGSRYVEYVEDETWVPEWSGEKVIYTYKGVPVCILNDSDHMEDLYEYRESSGFKFIEKQDEYYTLRLHKDDKVFIVPRSEYTLFPGMIILIRDSFSSYDRNNEKFSKDGLDLSKSIYIAFFETVSGFNYNVGNPLQLKYNENLSDVINTNDTEIIRIFEKIFNIEKVEYSEASGLLNGYFCEPDTVQENTINGGRTVTRWKYHDGGRKKLSQSILNTGSLYDSPLALTKSDSFENAEGISELISSKGIYGKAELFFKKLLDNEDIISDIFSPYKVGTKVEDWVNVNKNPIFLGDVICYDDYRTQQLSIDNGFIYYNKLNIKSSNTGKVSQIKYDEIFNYISRYDNLFQPQPGTDRIMLNIERGQSGVQVNEKIYQYYVFSDNKFLRESNPDIKSYLENDPYTVATVEYTQLRRRVDESEVKRDSWFLNPYIRILSPYELFSTSDRESWPNEKGLTYQLDWTYSGEPGTYPFEEELPIAGSTNIISQKWESNPILIYPETKDNFPYKMILMSRTDLGLDTYEEDKNKNCLVSFFNSEGKILMFKVEALYNDSPSEITKMRYSGVSIEDNHSIDETFNGSFAYDVEYEMEYDEGVITRKEEEVSFTDLGVKDINVGYSIGDTLYKVNGSWVKNKASTSQKIEKKATSTLVIDSLISKPNGVIEAYGKSADKVTTYSDSEAGAIVNALNFDGGTVNVGSAYYYGDSDHKYHLTTESECKANGTSYIIVTDPVTESDDSNSTGDYNCIIHNLSENGFTWVVKDTIPTLVGSASMPAVGDTLFYGISGAPVSKINEAVRIENVLSVSGNTVSARVSERPALVTVEETKSHSNKIRKKIIKYKVKDKSHDVYVYILSPIRINIGGSDLSSLELRNRNDVLIKIDKEFKNLNPTEMIPATNDPSYFSCEPVRNSEDSEYHYVLNESVKGSSLESLKNSFIIKGLPNETSKLPSTYESSFYEENQKVIQKYGKFFDDPLNSFLNEYILMMDEDSDLGKVLKKGLFNLYKTILGNWEVSYRLDDDPDSSIKLKDVSDILSNMKNLSNTLSDLIESGNVSFVSEEGESLLIASDDISSLKSRISKTDDYHIKKYSLNIDEDVEIPEEGTVTSKIASYFNSSATNKPLDIESEISEYTSKYYKYDDMIETLNKLFKENTFELEDAKKLDSYFGTDTYSVLRVRENKESKAFGNQLYDILNGELKEYVESTLKEIINDSILDGDESIRRRQDIISNFTNTLAHYYDHDALHTFIDRKSGDIINGRKGDPIHIRAFPGLSQFPENGDANTIYINSVSAVREDYDPYFDVYHYDTIQEDYTLGIKNFEGIKVKVMDELPETGLDIWGDPIDTSYKYIKLNKGSTYAYAYEYVGFPNIEVYETTSSFPYSTGNTKTVYISYEAKIAYIWEKGMRSGGFKGDRSTVMGYKYVIGHDTSTGSEADLSDFPSVGDAETYYILLKKNSSFINYTIYRWSNSSNRYVEEGSKWEHITFRNPDDPDDRLWYHPKFISGGVEPNVFVNSYIRDIVAESYDSLLMDEKYYFMKAGMEVDDIIKLVLRKDVKDIVLPHVAEGRGTAGFNQRFKDNIVSLRAKILEGVYNRLKPDVHPKVKSAIKKKNKDLQALAKTDKDVMDYLEDTSRGNYQFGVDDNDKVFFSFNVPGFSRGGDLIPKMSNGSYIVCNYKFSVDSSEPEADINLGVLRALNSFIRLALEGTYNKAYPPVEYLSKNKELRGRTNGLYYKRYQMLNNRMNKMNGPLYRSASYIYNNDMFNDSKRISDYTISSYDKYVNVLPIEDIDSLTYMSRSIGATTNIEIPGKYYSDKEMNALRKEISSSCILTCNHCSLKESCPFYDQEEVIKIYCTPMESIDIYLKDNELDLLDEDSIEIVDMPEGGSFNLNDFKKKHQVYSDVMISESTNGKTTKYYDEYNIESVRSELKSQSGLHYEENVKDGMSWLLGGRYGTVEVNPIQKAIQNQNIISNNSIATQQASYYRYLYNALFIKTYGYDRKKDGVPYMKEDSYISYNVPDKKYLVEYELGPAGDKKHYKAKVKLKMPKGIKIIEDAGYNDDVYLVSDDVKDPNNNTIDPVIYLGKAGDLQYAFDIIDRPATKNMEDYDTEDTNIYADDVAQWCMNYIKGHCADDPCGETSDYSNRDQYWMEKVYKKVNVDNKETWIEYRGRERRPSGYQEPVIDAENFDDVLAVSGHPVVNTYYNFVRRVSIRIFDRNSGEWMIPWVNEKMVNVDNAESLDALKEKQRAVLPLMKTNLRFVVVKK